MLGLRVLRDAVNDGRRAVFFTLDYAECDVLPRLSDIRRPNPIPVGVFSKMRFLHAGEMRFS
ncbi:MAG: hypothetical protein R3197_07800 [Paracoccaceae bacterium]|nr:hypothetical protein [Paracoccaceae bacterium]